MESVLLASPGRKVCVSVQSLHVSLGGVEKGFIVSDEDGGVAYYDLYDEEGTLACMDGETCVVEETGERGVTLANESGEGNARFRLSWAEFEACCK